MSYRDFESFSAVNRLLNDCLLIRWSAVRIRPGEPVLTGNVSKTLYKNGTKKPVFLWSA